MWLFGTEILDLLIVFKNSHDALAVTYTEVRTLHCTRETFINMINQCYLHKLKKKEIKKDSCDALGSDNFMKLPGQNPTLPARAASWKNLLFVERSKGHRLPRVRTLDPDAWLSSRGSDGKNDLTKRSTLLGNADLWAGIQMVTNRVPEPLVILLLGPAEL